MKKSKKVERSGIMRILAIIPAYNEAQSIINVIEEIKISAPECDYLVINDGSTDNTARICRKNNYPLLDLPVNLGLTGAFQTGMLYALEKKYDAVIQIDGDGQHDPKYIASMAEIMQTKEADLVIASRYLKKKRKLSWRTSGNALLDMVIRVTTGKKITDSTSGMRMYGKRLLMLMATDINSTPEPDTVAYLMLSGAKIEECQVTMRERTTGESYLNTWRSISYMIHMSLSILLIQRLRKRGQI